MKDGRADGAILMEPARDDPHVTGMARHYHLVQCSEYCDNQAVSHVSVDNLAAAREVVLTLAGWATGASGSSARTTTSCPPSPAGRAIWTGCAF